MIMNTRPGAELLGGRAVAVRQRREGSHLALPARVADGDVAARSERRLLRLAVRAPHAATAACTGRRSRPISPRIRRAARAASGEPITRDVTGEEFYSTLYAISESTLEPGVIWTARTTVRSTSRATTARRGRTSRRRICRQGGRVQYIETSPHRKGSAYYAVYRYLLGDFAPYIYKTDDYGATWKRLTDGKNGIPERLADARRARGSGSRRTALRRHRVRDVHLVRQRRALAARSISTCRACRSPTSSVHHKDLIVATQGRSIWILDDVTPLHADRGRRRRRRAWRCSNRATRFARASVAAAADSAAVGRRRRGASPVPAVRRADQLLPRVARRAGR